MNGDSEVSSEDIARYLEDARLPVTEAVLEWYKDDVEAQDEIIATLDELAEPTPPSGRDYWDPNESEDQYAAFLTRCDIRRTDNGLLAGRTLAVKDNIAVGGVPMTCGSPFLNGFVPSKDATVVNRLLDAGARIVGKANMDEFALGGDADAMRFRLARNPNNPEHQPGGSSAGSGVAIATGQADIALGTDTGGSVRFPASFCGVVGVKPSRGLVSLDGFAQFSKTLDTIGTLSRSVEDSARALQAMAGEDSRDDSTRDVEPDDYVSAVEEGVENGPEDITIGVPTELFGHAPEIEAVIHEALDEMEDDGATVTEVTIPNFKYGVPAWLAIGMTELAAYFDANGVNYWNPSQFSLRLVEAFEERFEERPDEIGEFTAGAIVSGNHLIEGHGNRYYVKGQQARKLVTQGVADALADVDVLASPTTPILPPEWGDGYLEDNSLYDVVRNTGLFNLTGHPAVTVPCGERGGLPIGLQLISDVFADATVFKTAAAWEALSEA